MEIFQKNCYNNKSQQKNNKKSFTTYKRANKEFPVTLGGEITMNKGSNKSL